MPALSWTSRLVATGRVARVQAAARCTMASRDLALVRHHGQGPSHENRATEQDAVGGVAFVHAVAILVWSRCPTDTVSEPTSQRTRRGVRGRAGLSSSRQVLLDNPSLDAESVRAWAGKGLPADVLQRCAAWSPTI